MPFPGSPEGLGKSLGRIDKLGVSGHSRRKSVRTGIEPVFEECGGFGFVAGEEVAVAVEGDGD
jgi:hypothetical protein